MAMKGFEVNSGVITTLVTATDEKLTNCIARKTLAIQNDNEYISTPIDEFKKNISSLALGLAIGAGLDYLLDTDEPIFTIAGYKLAEAGLENKYNNNHKPKTTNTKSDLNEKNIEGEIGRLAALSFLEKINKKTEIKDKEVIQKEMEKLCDKSFFDD